MVSHPIFCMSVTGFKFYNINNFVQCEYYDKNESSLATFCGHGSMCGLGEIGCLAWIQGQVSIRDQRLDDD